MRVICNRAALLEALTVAASVVPTRTPKPVLQNLKLSAVDNVLTIEATDMEVSVRYRNAQVQVEQAGATLVPADKFLAIVRETQDDTLAISLEGTEAHIKGADSFFKIFTANPADFPELPSVAGDADVELAASVLKQLASQTLFAAAKEGTRYAFNGVLTTLDKQQLVMVATDGRRLAFSRGDVMQIFRDVKSSPFPKSIIPARSVNLVDKLLIDLETNVLIKLTENQVVFTTTNAVLTSNLLEGQFPPYEDVIPKETDKRMIAGTADLLSAVRRAALLTTDDTKGVRLDFTKEKGLVLQSRAAEAGEARVDFACKFEGQPISIGFNPTYIADGLKVVHADEVVFEMSTPKAPGLFRAGTSFLYVIMPVSL
jgi:DNA polymerase III subunit beta